MMPSDPPEPPDFFRDHAEVSKRDPLVQDLIKTPAFQRLRQVRFLGGIDYLLVKTPNGAQGNIRHTRYHHSVEVSRLAGFYVDRLGLQSDFRPAFVAAGLLHDVGHAPLSHSLEPVFKKQFGIDHHDITIRIVTGQLQIGQDVYRILRSHGIDVDMVVSLIEGNSTVTGSEFFSGPINFDTIEGIIRTHTYSNRPVTISPRAVVLAAALRHSDVDRKIVDRFWALKEDAYQLIINSPFGVLADLACQHFMWRNIHRFLERDYLSTEPAVFKKMPGLRDLLRSRNFLKDVERFIRVPATIRQRHFYIDRSHDFFARKDSLRYRQRRLLKPMSTIQAGLQQYTPAQTEASMAAIERAKAFSNERLALLRDRLSEVVPRGEIVITCGSYARREASEGSDIDFFVVASSAESERSAPGWLSDAQDIIEEVVPIQSAEDGAFSMVETGESILKNIGGANDLNAKFTRRMLLLLEGEWLVNEAGFHSLRREILQRYIGDKMTDHQLSLFLLNDVIRYYRTMAVDYEFKTNEGDKPKPWGIRNIKLVFSRKL